jgi:thiaminase/transcriptional activator TenA
MQSAEHIDKLLADIDCQSQRGQDLIKIFRTATQMEITFWQQALNAISQEDGCSIT